MCYSRPTVYAYAPNFVYIGLLCRPLLAKNPNFCRFLDLAFSVVANWQQSDKVNMGAQLQTFPYPTASKLFLYSNAFTAKSGAQSLTFESVMNKQTQTKNSTFLATPGAGEIRAPPNVAW